VGTVNQGPSLFALLARLPARVWLQLVLGLIGFVVLAVLGFAVIAGVAAVGLIAILAFKARVWIERLFTGRSVTEPPARPQARVTDVSYEIIEPEDRDRR
jgi:hypothetical protein